MLNPIAWFSFGKPSPLCNPVFDRLVQQAAADGYGPANMPPVPNKPSAPEPVLSPSSPAEAPPTPPPNAPTETPMPPAPALPTQMVPIFTRGLMNMVEEMTEPPSPTVPPATPFMLPSIPEPVMAAPVTGKGPVSGAIPPSALENPTASPPVSVQAPAQPPSPKSGAEFQGTLHIAQIDSFSVQHGPAIGMRLEAGGSDNTLAGKVKLLQYDIGNGNEQKLNDALTDILARVNRGESIDAVNISLQDFVSSPQTRMTRALVDQLAAKGVPVAIAAGNHGPSDDNQLEGTNTFNVQSTTNGQVNATSGLGNITSEGPDTSFATANLTPTLALLHAQGFSINEIRAFLAKKSA